jgi:hypothetical protein
VVLLGPRAFRRDFNAKGAVDCTTHANPNVTEHNKTPVHAFAAPTGVISPEYGQAVPPFRGGKLHCLGQKLFEERTPHNRNSIIDGSFFCSRKKEQAEWRRASCAQALKHLKHSSTQAPQAPQALQ